MKREIEVEGDELLMENSNGDKVIIPKHLAPTVKKLIAAIDDIVDELPIVEDTAGEGGVVTEKKLPDPDYVKTANDIVNTFSTGTEKHDPEKYVVRKNPMSYSFTIESRDGLSKKVEPTNIYDYAKEIGMDDKQFDAYYMLNREKFDKGESVDLPIDVVKAYRKRMGK